jgi:hypothetical protein
MIKNGLSQLIPPTLHWNVSEDQVNARGLARGVPAVPGVSQTAYICPEVNKLT